MQTNVIHIVNGDCLAGMLLSHIPREQIIVCRECFIVGDVKEKNIQRFWNKRAEFISEAYSDTTENYYEIVVGELSKINKISMNQEVNLWFEDDLFCQVNLWFMLSLLSLKNFSRIYRVFPEINAGNLFSGFTEMAESKIHTAIADRIIFKPSDLNLGLLLWEAYQDQNFELLKKLSQQVSPCFRNLDQVCQAHIQRFEKIGRPEKVLLKVIGQNNLTFEEVFHRFTKEEPVYGFGDLQVKEIYEKLKKNN